MKMRVLSPATRARRAALLCATILATYAAPAMAQAAQAPSDAPAPAASTPTAPPASAALPAAGSPESRASATNPSGNNADAQEIVVTGYRQSLAQSTAAKRESTSFTDSIFAEDIGKFPDTNIAESVNRIPGITISREITGEGLNIAIRGLGTNFTRVLLNDAPVAVASTGGTDAQSTNREVDLDLFPTELFTRLTVNKTSTADTVEGGAAGTVNLRSARPFDRPGTHVTYSLQGTHSDHAGGWGGRGALIASATFGNFGILAGGTAVRNKFRVLGFETIGWTNPNLSVPPANATAAQIAASQCRAGTSGCNVTGGGNWTIPGTVPANAGNGLTTGATINQDLLLALNPGATLQQIDNGLIPRLGRDADEFGRRDRYNGIVALEWRPSEDLHFYVDSMYGRKRNRFERIDMNWVGRNGAAIPINTKYDRTDCSGGCVVTEGTYANSQFFLEYRPYKEDVKFYGINPGAEWNITSNLKLDVQGNYTHSNFHRESPTVLVITPASSGLTVTYKNDGGVPTIESSKNLNDPNNFGWPGGRVNIQDEKRRTITKGARANLTWGGEAFSLKAGGAYDETSRLIRAFDNTQAWQNAVCGDNPNVFLPGPNRQPSCQGLNITGTGAQVSANPAAAGGTYPSYPAYGTGFSGGKTGPVTYGGSLIPNSALPGYLKPGPSGFITIDWPKFAQASQYQAFHDAAPVATGANTGANAGSIRERVGGAYIEANGRLELGDNALRYNVGMRYVSTDQQIGGFRSLADARNQPPGVANACPGASTAGFPTDGSCYPSINTFVYTKSKYHNWLPAGNLAFNIGESAVVRGSLSRTMTRPDPNAQLPGVSFGSPSADNVTVGNPSLKPFISNNIDVGFEYYTGREGYFGIAAFRKTVTGFTSNFLVTVPFSSLAAYGITFDTITATQQAAITSRGGPAAATVVQQQQVNATGNLRVNGLEFNWVQPLDFILDRYLGIKGFGFNANLTYVDQKGSGAAPAVAIGVPAKSYNITVYYQNNGIELRLAQVYNGGSQASTANQNSIPNAALFNDPLRRFDFSSIFDLEKLTGINNAPQFVFDVTNIFKAKQRQYFQFDNATFTEYRPGRSYMIGLRGTF
ncbi:TonB-dependent receptor [Sphingomonas crusticola]|uniref:TonB-dependent receptor n=1 Tax=Sphingomonas crusticola TaxID=1697973 RepID=UPI001F07164E|nr:TonB-dependent receptor [Sphingomonas crusticola]